jgi:hypothetical protein
MFDATDGYAGDPKLVTVFPTECYGDASCELAQIVEGPIPFFSLCEHHALPFYGQAYVGLRAAGPHASLAPSPILRPGRSHRAHTLAEPVGDWQ